jgi:hypothetical protein
MNEFKYEPMTDRLEFLESDSSININPDEIPVYALPHKLQRICKAMKAFEQFDFPFFVPAVLSVAATCIGNSYTLKVSAERKESAILFIAIVARKGAGKTAPLNYAFKYLRQYDLELRNKSNEEQRLHDEYIATQINKRHKSVANYLLLFITL